MSAADGLQLHGPALELGDEGSLSIRPSQTDSQNGFVGDIHDEATKRFEDEDAGEKFRAEFSPTAAMRKSHSAVGSYRSSQKLSAQADILEAETNETQRPYTAATSSPSKFNMIVSTKKKKPPSAAKKSSFASVESSSSSNTTTQRPRSAGLDGWGDFDADQLLEDDFAMSNPIDEGEEMVNAIDELALANLEPECVRPRRNRHSAPPTTIHNPAEDFPAMPQATESARSRASKEQPPRPVTHVFRQRPLAVVDSNATPSQRLKNKFSVEKMARLSGLRGQVQPPAGSGPPPSPSLQQQSNRLPRMGGHGFQQQVALQQLQVAPLFGALLPDSQEIRAQIFDRFRHLWSLMSSRSPSACIASTSSSLQALYPGNTSTVAAASLQQCKSPFECSMTLMKICKSAGIPFSSSASTSSLSFWSSKARDVDFVSFCDSVVRIAIQPALEHFQKDSSIDEYISTVDRILQNVITTSSSPSSSSDSEPPSQHEDYRVKELGEIPSLFPQWKVGAASLGKPRLKTKATGNSGGAGSEASNPATELQDEKISNRHRLLTPSFPSRRELTFQLPTEEAKATHLKNIRRKVQLHKSWQPQPTLLNNASFNSITALHAVSDSSVVSYVPVSASVGHSSPMKTNGVNHRGHGVMISNDLLLGCATSMPLYPKRSDAEANQDSHHQESGTAAASDGDDHDFKESPSEHEKSSSLEEPDNFEKGILHEDPAQHKEEDEVLTCDSAFADRRHLKLVWTWFIITLSDGLGADSKAAQAVWSWKQRQQQPSIGDDLLADKATRDWKTRQGDVYSEAAPAVPAKQTLTESHAMLTMSSHSILLPLPKARSLKGLDKKNSLGFESTSNMVKAFILGSASSASLSSSAAASTTTSASQTSRKYVDLKKRTKLHPASVLLDPTQVFANGVLGGP